MISEPCSRASIVSDEPRSSQNRDEHPPFSQIRLSVTLALNGINSHGSCSHEHTIVMWSGPHILEGWKATVVAPAAARNVSSSFVMVRPSTGCQNKEYNNAATQVLANPIV